MKTVGGLLIALCVCFASTLEAQVIRAQVIKDASTIKYHMSHPLHEFDAVSKEAVYIVNIDPAKKQISDVSAEVDVTTFDSGNSNRDSHAMEVIDAISYPEVTFRSTGVTQNGDSLRVAGKLTFHGITRDIVIPAAVSWGQNRLDVHGKFDITLTEFKIERPSLLMIPVADDVNFTVEAAFKW